MAEVLLTGGTGVLGSALVPALRAAGHGVRVLSRGPGEGRVVGDLVTGAGLTEAMVGVELVLHAATAFGPKAWLTDVEGTRRLAVAARDAGVRHLVYVSIPGIDRIPLPYYRAKYAAEQVVAASGVPWTTVCASQFHPLVAALLGTLHRGPVLPVPAEWRVEPVAVRDVAEHLARRVGLPPSGTTEGFAGPERRQAADLARSMLAVRGEHGYVLPVPVPGRVSRAIRAGANLLDAAAPRGTVTWQQWLASPEAAAETAAYRDRGR